MSGKESGKKNKQERQLGIEGLFQVARMILVAKGPEKGKKLSINSSTMNVNTNKDSKIKYWKLFDKSIKTITRMFVITEKKLCETTFEGLEITQIWVDLPRIKML